VLGVEPEPRGGSVGLGIQYCPCLDVARRVATQDDQLMRIVGERELVIAG